MFRNVCCYHLYFFKAEIQSVGIQGKKSKVSGLMMICATTQCGLLKRQSAVQTPTHALL